MSAAVGRAPRVTGVRIDLHAHSTASDGTAAAGGVVAAARGRGARRRRAHRPRHDRGLGRGRGGGAAATGVALVPGMEISCAVDGISVHLLAYLHDPARPRAGRRDRADARRAACTRARRMVELLARRTSADLGRRRWRRSRPGATVGRPHIADALVRKGSCATATRRSRTACHARSALLRAPLRARRRATAVRLVRAAGGVPVMAHPLAARRGRVVERRASSRSWPPPGLAGLEVDHRDHDAPTRAHLRGAGRATSACCRPGSSDYHGTGKLEPARREHRPTPTCSSRSRPRRPGAGSCAA